MLNDALLPSWPLLDVDALYVNGWLDDCKEEGSMTTERKGPLMIYTGAACGCRHGVERDNCPRCEGTGKALDFAAIRAVSVQRKEDSQS